MALKMIYLCSCGTAWDTDQWEAVETHLAANPTHVVSEAYADSSGPGVPPAVPVVSPGGTAFSLQTDDDGAILSESSGGGISKVPKTRYDATTNPTATDDESEGYDVGSRWINTSTDDEWVCLNPAEGAAIWTATTVQPGPFGSVLYYEQDDKESDTSSEDWQTKMTLSLPSLPSGTYRLAYHAELYHKDNARFADFRVLLDKKIVAEAAPFIYFNSFPWTQATGFLYLDLSGSHEFVMQWRSSQRNKTALIRRARLEAWRIK